ncbi:MAG: lipopolysaccharide kinase InaA family protein [Candidatus Accumulibacter sp.]|nr:lipopolysaccharide kinase InaA family protein [Accumulibacter sp.]
MRQRDPAHPSLYCKRQTGYTYRTLSHPFVRPTILRERRAYRAFSRLGIKTPDIVYCAARQERGRWQALLLTEALREFVSLEQWYAGNKDEALGKAVLRRLAATLARLHLAGWQHGCGHPKHIFVKAGHGENEAPQVEIALLDLEKSRRRWCSRNASRHDLCQLTRHRGNMPEADLLFFRRVYRRLLGRGRFSWTAISLKTILRFAMRVAGTA